LGSGVGFGDFRFLRTGECDGVGVLPGDVISCGFLAGDLDGVGLFAGDFCSFGSLAGDFNGVGVLAGDGFGDGVTLTFSDLDFPWVRGWLSRTEAVGHGIAVGSSTAVGRVVAVAVAAGERLVLGVGAAAGINKRPRRCDIGDDTEGRAIGVSEMLGNGVCAGDIATIPTIAINNAKQFRIAPKEVFG
jgi:hypothetical protein